ncbi:MAG: hypothetical protein JWP75_795 [Frondihabitans sp.]|nr:hypothetical protein [Frondihabitans sp.]
MVAVAITVALLAAFVVSAPQVAHADASTGAGGLFVSNTTRIYDTNSGTGDAPTAGLAAGSWYSIPVEGVGTIPATGVSAVQVNFVVTNSTSTAGYLHADAGAVTTPNTTVAYVNYPATTAVANAATIAVGSNGAIQVQASTAASLRVDVQGYYSSGSTAAGGYVPLAASVIANTADGTGGVAVAKVASQSTLTFPVAGSAGVPTDASGVVLNIQESGSGTTGGYIIPFGAGQARPSTALYWPGQRVYDWTTNVNLPSSGGVSIYVAGGPVNLVVSIEGYFTASTNGSGAGQFTPAAARVYDSRTNGNVPLAAGEARTIQVTGTNGVPAMTSGLTSVAVDITVIPPAGSSGSVSAYADDAAPGPDTGYFVANSTMTVFAIVPLGADGGIILQNNSQGNADMVVDVEGWYSGLSAPTIACQSGFADGSWTKVLPSTPITCTITAPVAEDSTDHLEYGIDSIDPPTDVLLSATSQTVVTVQIQPTQGGHQIWATNGSDSFDSIEANYSFDLGDWTTAGFVPGPADGDTTTLTPNLTVQLGGTSDLPADAQVEYFVSTDAAGSNVVWNGYGDDINGVWPDDLTSQTYYWWATITGSVDPDGTQGSVTTPTYSFIASDATAGAQQSSPASSTPAVHDPTGTVCYTGKAFTNSKSLEPNLSSITVHLSLTVTPIYNCSGYKIGYVVNKETGSYSLRGKVKANSESGITQYGPDMYNKNVEDAGNPAWSGSITNIKTSKHAKNFSKNYSHDVYSGKYNPDLLYYNYSDVAAFVYIQEPSGMPEDRPSYNCWLHATGAITCDSADQNGADPGPGAGLG